MVELLWLGCCGWVVVPANVVKLCGPRRRLTAFLCDVLVVVRPCIPTPCLFLGFVQVMGKGRKRKLRPEEAGGQPGVFRWKAERKR